MFVSPINRLSASNAAFNWMSSAGSLMSLTTFGGNPTSLLSAENNLAMGMLNDSLIYKASLLQEESMKKLENENIKRTFSTFA